MVHLNSCWSPCFWHGNVADGSIAVAIYTFSMSICIIMYSINVITGVNAGISANSSGN